MSDTPRTNLEAFFPHDSMYQVCDSDFARKLERELNAANSKIELLMSANADVARIADERDAAENRIRLLIAERDTARLQADRHYNLREEFRELLGTVDVEQGVAVVRGLQQRINRLEEMYEGEIGENEQFLGSNLQGLLTRELNWSKERIKRLEEAGDEMYRWITVKRLCSIDCTEAWDKAKEAKP